MNFKDLFFQPLKTRRQWLIILLIAICYMVFMPVQPSCNDWQLNTTGIWKENYLQIYNDANRVYPPWGVLLLLPLFFMRIEGMRFFSVLIIAWLVKQKKWSLFQFLNITLSPYFIYTMYLVNMDIFTTILPILIWEAVEKEKFQIYGRSIALILLSIKPQGGIFVALYFAWINRKNIRSIIFPALLSGLVILPFSIVGSPPLLIQWMNNIIHPSPQNQYFWSFNNISITSSQSIIVALSLFLALGILLLLIIHSIKPESRKDVIFSYIIMAALMISPYASMQSVISSTAFLPALTTLIIGSVFCALLSSNVFNLQFGPVFLFLSFSLSMVLYAIKNPLKNKLLEFFKPEKEELNSTN